MLLGYTCANNAWFRSIALCMKGGDKSFQEAFLLSSFSTLNFFFSVLSSLEESVDV